MLRREIRRRPAKSELEKIPLATAFDQAIEALEISGQRAAHATIESALETFATAEDALHELRTGKEPLRAEVARVTKKHFPQSGEGTA
jgi:hypothetical protein